MATVANIIFSLIMGIFMSLIITLAISFVRVGAHENFFWIWFDIWSIAYPVAIICILIFRPFASKMTAMILIKLNSLLK
jgi:hypothetical protein